MSTPRPVLSSIPCDPAEIPRLRVGRKVPAHIYEQLGDEPDDDDRPLFTVPKGIDGQQIVDGLEALRWLNLNPEETDVD